MLPIKVSSTNGPIWSLFDTDILSAKAREAGFTLAVCRDLFIHHFDTRTFAHGAPSTTGSAPDYQYKPVTEDTKASEAMELLRRVELGSYLNEAGLTGPGVIVGARPGDFARRVLAHWQGNSLMLVDRWEDELPSGSHEFGWSKKKECRPRSSWPIKAWIGCIWTAILGFRPSVPTCCGGGRK